MTGDRAGRASAPVTLTGLDTATSPNRTHGSISEADAAFGMQGNPRISIRLAPTVVRPAALDAARR